MTATPSASLPTAEPSDSSDVSVALEAAAALWQNGEVEEAMRWIARAAEGAEQAGDDRRALELARALADLKDGLAGKAEPPPEAAPKRVTRPPPLPGAETAPKFVPKAPPPPPPPPSARKASLPPTPPSMRPRTPEAVTMSSAAEPAPSPPTESPAAKHLPSAPPSPTNPVTVAKPSVSPQKAAVSVSPQKAAASVSPQKTSVAEEGDRLRVSVKSSVRDPDLLLVRVLRSGQSAPSGCHEAFLSPTESGLDLRRIRP